MPFLQKLKNQFSDLDGFAKDSNSKTILKKNKIGGFTLELEDSNTL